ncbi:MAG: TolC family protein [Cyclobacteriaceae bacterium]
MRKMYAVLLLVLAGLPVDAQTVPGKTMNLEQCVQYALDNSVSAQNAVIDERIAEARVKETIGIGLPQVSGTAGALYNDKLSRFFGTKQRIFGFSGLPASDYGNFLPGLPDDAVVSGQNFFQLKAAASANLSISQLIFNGSYIVGLQASRTFKELAYKTTDQTREQVIEQVTKAFYSALINRERIHLFDANIARIDSLLRNTEALNKNGFAESIDVDRMQVTMNNLVTERAKFLKLQELSVELLKFQMNYPMEQSLVIDGEISGSVVAVDYDSYLKDWDYKNRIDYQILETNFKLQSLNIRNKYASALPAVFASANIGYSTQSTDVSGLFVTRSNISDNGAVGPDKWYPVSSYGVNVSIPIFSGLQRTYQLQQEKLRLQKIENGFRQVKSGIDLQVKQATTMYQNATEALKAQQRNMDLAIKVARVTRIKYEQGVGSNLEVVTAEAALKEAQVNYYNALFDALVAKVDLDKAFGKLLAAYPENNK